MASTMQRRRRWIAVLTAVAALLGFGAPAHAGQDDDGRHDLVVSTYNVDFGTDLTPLFSVTNPAALAAAAQRVFAQMQASDYAARAEAVAGLVARERPDVAGFQEIAAWATLDLTNPTNGFVNLAPFDYQALLIAALARHGLTYTVAVSNVTFEKALPVSAALAVRFTDKNVILVRAGSRHGVAVTAVAQGQYVARMHVAALNLDVTRGWASADLTLDGRAFRFYTTHLEAYTDKSSTDDPDKSFYRDQQADELMKMAHASTLPVIITGDINSRPPCDGTNTAAYRTIARGGYTEVWAALHGTRRCGGFTSGQDGVASPVNSLDHRIDVIFFRTSRFRAVATDVIGDRLRDKTPNGLWPSDHAGSVATLQFRQDGGHDHD